MIAVTLAETVKGVLESVPGIELAVLFGSTARGRAGSHSDIDIAIAMAPTAEAPPALEVALERAAGRPASITLLHDAPPLLRFEIGRDGIVLVERQPGIWKRFRAQAMIDWWDWAPTVHMMHRAMARRLREEAGRGPA
jgi:predicted nucleotidyltransferase